MFTGSLGPKDFSVRYVKNRYVILILVYVTKVASKTLVVLVVVIFENWQAEMPIFKQRQGRRKAAKKLLDHEFLILKNILEQVPEL